MEKVAIIDLGSNSARMSIFDKESGKTTASFRKTVGLSQGMTEDLVLKPQAMLRAANALLRFKEIIDEQKIKSVKTIATAAVRKAKNGDEFISLVRDMTTLQIEVIDGETEGSLDAFAVRQALGIDQGLICDIGGGSCEFIALGKKTSVVSIPWGCRGIAERFFGNGEDEDGYIAARQFAKELFRDVHMGLSGVHFVGLGGTFSALSALSGCDFKERNRLDISREEVNALLKKIKASDLSERLNMPGIGKDRADIIMGGVVLLEEILDRFAPSKLTFTPIGVREGAFYSIK